MITEPLRKEQVWPALPLAEWKDTCVSLHMMSQIVGKVRLALSPHVNHWWQVPLYVNARGLTTSAIPFKNGIFEIQFDLIDHKVEILTNWDERRSLWLVPRSISDFYREFMELLHSAGIDVKIWPMPVEVPDPIRFDLDHEHGSYDPDYAHRFWRILVEVDAIFKEFRTSFIGKNSPIHFFWGSFDHAVTRFSGRRAPERPGADRVTKEAYSHEVSSVGFWPGGGIVPDAAFYAYAAPEPPGFRESRIRPRESFYAPDLREFVLMYDVVRQSEDPKAKVLEFCQSTYEAAAVLGKWDREALER